VNAQERPELISAPRPSYPPIAKAKHISGVVLIDVTVNSDGHVIEAAVLMGGEYIRETAKKSALEWRFKPLSSSTTKNYSVRLTFIFHEYGYYPPEKEPDFKSPYQSEIMY
jgi:TonB family protein